MSINKLPINTFKWYICNINYRDSENQIKLKVL